MLYDTCFLVEDVAHRVILESQGTNYGKDPITGSAAKEPTKEQRVAKLVVSLVERHKYIENDKAVAKQAEQSKQDRLTAYDDCGMELALDGGGIRGGANSAGTTAKRKARSFRGSVAGAITATPKTGSIFASLIRHSVFWVTLNLSGFAKFSEKAKYR